MCQDCSAGRAGPCTPCDRAGLRFAHDTPSVEFDSFDEFVRVVAQARNIYHELLVAELSLAGTRGEATRRFMQSWTRIRQEGARALMHATKRAPVAAEWARDANDTLVITLKATSHAYLCHVRSVVADELSLILSAQLDTLLGYPDCCWGWGGAGVLRDLLRTSFHTFATPTHMNIVPKSQWPHHVLALLMATHPRLGAGSGLCGLDSELFRVVLALVLSPPAPQVHRTVIE